MANYHVPQSMRRTRFIHSRVTPAERQIVKEAADRCNMTVSSFIYNATMKAAQQLGVFANSRPAMGDKT